jgi:hypothetical protein
MRPAARLGWRGCEKVHSCLCAWRVLSMNLQFAREFAIFFQLLYSAEHPTLHLYLVGALLRPARVGLL